MRLEIETAKRRTAIMALEIASVAWDAAFAPSETAPAVAVTTAATAATATAISPTSIEV
jgi:hypothetical protein